MKQLFRTPEGRAALHDSPAPTRLGSGAITQTKYSALCPGPEPATPTHLALGGSNAGIILETSPNLDGFRPGDVVACAGRDCALHAEQCSVPQHLLARCPAGVDARDAAFAGFGAIALQALRRGNCEVGGSIAVIGLDLIGLLSIQIARSAGTRVLAVGGNRARRDVAAQVGVDLVADAGRAAETAREFTGDLGVDLVLVTGDDPGSAAPLELALGMVRHRGRVVVVGDRKCEFPGALWERKDAELLIAGGCGPGDSDPQYERQGHDYPVGFVRWTVQRNLQEFVRLLGSGAVKVAPLITHEFPFARAADAWELLRSKPDECLGVALKY